MEWSHNWSQLVFVFFCKKSWEISKQCEKMRDYEFQGHTYDAKLALLIRSKLAKDLF